MHFHSTCFLVQVLDEDLVTPIYVADFSETAIVKCIHFADICFNYYPTLGAIHNIFIIAVVNPDPSVDNIELNLAYELHALFNQALMSFWQHYR